MFNWLKPYDNVIVLTPDTLLRPFQLNTLFQFFSKILYFNFDTTNCSNIISSTQWEFGKGPIRFVNSIYLWWYTLWSISTLWPSRLAINAGPTFIGTLLLTVNLRQIIWSNFDHAQIWCLRHDLNSISHFVRISLPKEKSILNKIYLGIIIKLNMGQFPHCRTFNSLLRNRLDGYL